jgi:RsiW-degrading membrane proteinase PrsW (M82 family)
MQGLAKTPLSPAPKNLYLSQTSSRWKTVSSMLGLVIVVFFLVQIAVVAVSGFLDADFDGKIGPSDPLLIMIGAICSTPFLLLFIILRRPKLAHIVRLQNVEIGSTAHLISPSTLFQTPYPTSIQHHLVHNTGPLEVPPLKHLWIIFILGTIISTLCMLPLLFNSSILSILLFILIAIPAWLIGFSTPVFAWWATSNEYFGLKTTKRQGEWMLIAGMLSTFPALIINSIISPIIISSLGISMDGVESLGFGMILFLSAPIGEEISKAVAILFLARFIDSPKRGFQIGFSVGLGFALLENMSYILSSLFVGEGAAISFILTTVLRAIGSIPGHATWTAITGFAIGHHITTQKRNRDIINGVQDSTRKDNESPWILFDKKTGTPISSSSVNVSPVIPKWLSAGEQNAIQMTKSPIKALLIAILCHGTWNGTMWLSSRLLADKSLIFMFLVDMILVAVLIVILWIILRRLIPYAIDDRNSSKI